MVKIPRWLTTIFLSNIFLLLFLVVLETTELSLSPLHTIANAFAGSPDNGFHKLLVYTEKDALARTMENLKRNVREKSILMDTLRRYVLLTFNDMDTKIETSKLNNMSRGKKSCKEYNG